MIIISDMWQARAACQNAPRTLFISATDGDNDASEPHYPTRDALRLCERCPVRAECYAHAELNNEWGIWGGTTRYQRSLLRRTMKRATCPACAARHVVPLINFEVCLTCGVSWRSRK